YRLGASRRFFACVKPKFEDSPEGLCLTCEAPSRSEGSPKGFPRYNSFYTNTIINHNEIYIWQSKSDLLHICKSAYVLHRFGVTKSPNICVSTVRVFQFRQTGFSKYLSTSR